MQIIQPDYRCPHCKEIISKGEALLTISRARHMSKVGFMLRGAPDEMITCLRCGSSVREEDVASGRLDAVDPERERPKRMTLIWWTLGLVAATAVVMVVLLTI